MCNNVYIGVLTMALSYFAVRDVISPCFWAFPLQKTSGPHCFPAVTFPGDLAVQGSDRFERKLILERRTAPYLLGRSMASR